MKSCTVAITGMNTKQDNPGPGLAIARCLHESKAFKGRIIGLGYDAFDPGLYLHNWCDASYLLPYPSSGEKVLLERLQFIHTHESIDIIIPCLDTELLGFIHLGPELKKMGIRYLLPSAEQLQRREKDRLEVLAKSAGLMYPRLEPVIRPDFFSQCQRKGWEYPLVIKGRFYNAVVVHTPQEANQVFARIAYEWGYPVFVQQFVKGEESNLVGIGDGHGRLHGAVMMKKRAITYTGKAWAGVCIADDYLLKAAQALVEALNWSGPLEVEVLRDRNGRYYLLEINPRFPSWVYLSHGVGVNLPQLLINLMNGESVPDNIQPITGKLFIRYAQEVLISLEQFESMVIHGQWKEVRNDEP